MRNIRVLVLPTDSQPYVTEVLNEAPALHDLIGGYFEVFHLIADDELIGLCDDEGRLKQLPMNPVASVLNATSERIMGRAVIVRPKRADFVSLSDEDIATLRNFLNGYVDLVRSYRGDYF